MFGTKLFPGVGYPTPVSIPDTTTCLTLQIPADDEWWALVVGLIYTLTLEWNWQQFEGGIERDAAASRFQQMLEDALALASESNSCDLDVPAPFWDEDSGDDSDDSAPITEQPWYGQLVLIDDNLTFVENAFIYVVAGFIAYAGLPTAAISFVPIARNFVVTMKSNPLGGIVRFLADAVEIGRVDTYSAADGVVSTPIAMPAPTMSFVAEDVTTYPTLWVELLEDNPHDLESVSMTLIRSRLSEADFSPPNQRYNADCDCIQITPDGGTTWNDAPGLDPRHSPAFLKPPVAGSSKQCDAAANMVKWLKDFIDQATALMDAGALVTAVVNKLLEFIDLVFPGADLLTLILEGAGVIFDIGATALTAAFTSDQYDLLLCIFYCHADGDGRVSVDALAAIESDITAQLNTTAALVVNALLFIQGEIGLSNAGAIGSETGDCDACACTFCYKWDFRIESYAADGWAVESPYGQYSAGNGWQSHSGDGLILDLTFPTTVEITSVQWGGTAFFTADPRGRAVLYTLSGTTVYNSNEAGISNPYTQDVEHTDTVDKLRFNPYGSATADIYIQDVLITSSVEIPEWAARAC